MLFGKRMTPIIRASVFRNCSHAALSSTLLFPCASVCEGASAFIWISAFYQLMIPYLVYLAMYVLCKVCMTRCTIDKMLNELYACVVAKCCLIICMYILFVFCNCSHAALSSTLLFPCASVCGSWCVYMNFTIWSIDDSLFGISCDVYSLKNLCDSLYNDKMLFKLYVYMFFFSSVTVPMLFFLLILLFPCEWLWKRSYMSFSFPMAVLGGAFGLVFGSCIFNGCARDPLCMNFIISPFDQPMSPYLIYHAMLNL